MMPTRPPVHRPAFAPEPGAHDRERGSAAARGYDRHWRSFREQFLADHPLRKDCEDKGRVTAATDVHHLIKLRDRRDLRLDSRNCMALRQNCHSARTARGEQDGAPFHGHPLSGGNCKQVRIAVIDPSAAAPHA